MQKLLKGCNSRKVFESFMELQPFKSFCLVHYNDLNLPVIIINRSNNLLKLNTTHNIGT